MPQSQPIPIRQAPVNQQSAMFPIRRPLPSEIIARATHGVATLQLKAAKLDVGCAARIDENFVCLPFMHIALLTRILKRADFSSDQMSAKPVVEQTTTVGILTR